jgi:hypothetical protein
MHTTMHAHVYFRANTEMILWTCIDIDVQEFSMSTMWKLNNHGFNDVDGANMNRIEDITHS